MIGYRTIPTGKKADKLDRVVVIGAGIGGLTTAAVLSRAGVPVTVLEAHIYPGGCAGTFFHQAYRFDAGATLAGGFYPGGPMDLVGQAAGIGTWPARLSDPAMVVHLPNGVSVPRWSDDRRHAVREEVFGHAAEPFWRWQERTATVLWDLALRLPPWPPQTPAEAIDLVGAGTEWLWSNLPAGIRPSLAADLFRPVAAHLRGVPEILRQFVDAQLLISSQTTSAHANALYGASALDLPRRGVVHLEGGMGAIAQALVTAIRQNGGQVLFRKEVSSVVIRDKRVKAVETKRGEVFAADLVIANLPPWNIARLLGSEAPGRLSALQAQQPSGWGASMAYLGVDETVIPSGYPLHHQVVDGEPLGEGNTVFISISPEWDVTRAPGGRRAVTLSTHTALKPWWTLFNSDREKYEERKKAYATRLVTAAEQVLPGLSDATELMLPGTPVTFQRFTRRHLGWVGGFPQTSLFRAWAPRIRKDFWMVGDSIFPGQSTAAVALGGLRVANAVLAQIGVPAVQPGVQMPPSTSLVPEQ